MARLARLGLYMVVMRIASGALETAFRWRAIWVEHTRTYHTAHGSSYADDNKSALHTEPTVFQNQSSDTELVLTACFSICASENFHYFHPSLIGTHEKLLFKTTASNWEQHAFTRISRRDITEERNTTKSSSSKYFPHLQSNQEKQCFPMQNGPR
jgi:hypothetical protein